MQLLDRQVSASLDLVAANRLAGAATAPRYVIITVGVLATGSLESATFLGDAAVAGNAFDGFTFATWFSAYMEILRLEENTVTNGVAGLWLETVDAGPVPGAVPRNPYYQSTILFEEYQLLVALAATFPPPTSRAAVSRLADTSADQTFQTAFLDVRQPPPYSLVVSGNQVDVRVQTATAGASAAMLLALYREGLQPLTSIIVQSNRLCGGMAAVTTDVAAGTQAAFAKDVPAALVTLQNGTSCAINGNVVINRGGVGGVEGQSAPSLWVMVSESVDGIDQVAITGNVLKGQSDLGEMNRSALQTTWSPYNANPS